MIGPTLNDAALNAAWKDYRTFEQAGLNRVR